MHTPRWRTKSRNSIRTIAQLERYIELTPDEKRKLQKVIERHPMCITRYYMSLINRDDPDDPIRKMAVPSEGEFDLSGSYDTSGELENTKMSGLQHKYSQTALILVTNRCWMYCRYCFRKRLIGLSSDEILHRFSSAVDYIRKHEEINNVLITGGDPFVLSTRIISRFLDGLSGIEHLDFIRFGSRTPVTFPERFLDDDKLLDVLKTHSLPDRRIYVVTQFNHPREITEESTEVVNRLIESNVIEDNQTVLLKGVNDDPKVLGELQNRLVSIGIVPYYIFQCRPVKRVKHDFQVPLKRGYEIIKEAEKMCSGHSKRFKYIMSHRTGKIEIVGIMDDHIYFKYHQVKNPKNAGKFFRRKINETAGWLDDLDIASN